MQDLEYLIQILKFCGRYALKCTKHHYLQELVCFYNNTSILLYVLRWQVGGLQPPTPLNPPLSHCVMRGIGMGMQCGPVEGFTQQVSLYWNEQLLMYLRKKTLQERQQALFLEFHGKGITRLLIVVFICWHQRRKRKLLIDQYDHRLEVYALHMIIQMHSYNRY